jgi:hypothetical protein
MKMDGKKSEQKCSFFYVVMFADLQRKVDMQTEANGIKLTKSQFHRIDKIILISIKFKF